VTEVRPIAKNAAHEAPPAGLKVTDIYYIVFRHKWLVLGFFVAGLIAAIIVYASEKPRYSSEAKLLVRYVVDTKAAEAGVGAQTRPVGSESIIKSEFEILTSLDLCEEVAVAVGPERILGKDGGSNVMAAAMTIRNGITPDNPPGSSIIRVQFSHSDPTVCQAVLRQVMDSYFSRHKTLHRDPPEFERVLSDEAAQLLVRVRENEKTLRKLKAEAGVISIDDAKKGLSDQLSSLRKELFNAEAQLAEFKTILGREHRKPDKVDKEKENAGPAPSREKIAEYTWLRARLDTLRNREFDMLASYTEDNPQVKRLREQIVSSEQKRKEFETEFPKLPALYSPPSAGDNRFDPARLTGLESRIEAITNQLAEVREDVALLDNLEGSILEVQRKLTIDQNNYMNVASRLESQRFDDALSAVKNSNIQAVQTPSPPSLNVAKRFKLVGGAFFGFLIAGLGIAFLIEIFLDHSVRRPVDIETKLKLPLFLSIPKLGFNGHAKLLPFPARALLTANGEPAEADLHNTWAEDHPLRRYIDGLRDSTLTFFGPDPHKPKLIGVTSCSDGVGVTSLAAGLAGALSETGDGNVLLLNLNLEAQAVHPFYRGELACNLTDALTSDKRQNGMVLQNLYVATAGNPSDPATANLSKQLARVVPQLRVSDYDYIVFDLPPTTPTTMTARLAGMMDLVILVVESGKDSQDTVKQAARLLARSQAKVSAVLNKVQNPVPHWLHKGV